MEVTHQNLVKFFSPEQYMHVPIYQRKYSWEKKQCEKLFYDISEIGKSDKKSHFMGSIVFQSSRKEDFELIIIDGQQRITSMSLLILALIKYLKFNEDFINENFDLDVPKEIKKLSVRFLINQFDEDAPYKLILTQDDNEEYTKLVDGILNEEEFNIPKNQSLIYDNFKIFYEKIEQNNLNYILEGIGKLSIVTLDLQTYESPQEIFESLNSTGKDLNKADLVRNFLLMNLSPKKQKHIYDNYWHDIELVFDKNDLNFDNFLLNYLVMHYGERIYMKNVYETFKEFSKRFDDVELLVKDIQKVVKYFSKIVLGKEENPKIRLALKNLNHLSYDVIHPFLFNIYDDYEQKKINVQEFEEIIKLTESYVFRRFICDLDSQTMRYVFADMYQKLNKDAYLESYTYELLKDNSNRRMPDDDEFLAKFGSRDIFNMRGNRKYIFQKLEDMLNPNEHLPIISDKHFQIEHIMPQTLTDEWKKELGDDWRTIYRDFIHTIGNLTVIGYNPELKNKSFKRKKCDTPGYHCSRVCLNRYFDDLEKWNKEEIIKRRDILCDKAKELWKCPVLTDEIIDKYSE